MSQARGAELATDGVGPVDADALAHARHSALACSVGSAQWHGDTTNAAAWAAMVGDESAPPAKTSSILD
ncbi:MAG: hypothetical protein R2911_17875 [Caldilineaceae bacterium]